MRTGVLICGYNVHEKNWQDVVWGRPPLLLGRLPQGVKVFMQQEAEAIVFGTGASQIDGKIEAAVMRDYLLENFHKLNDFYILQDIDSDLLYKEIVKNCYLECKSKNTAEEVLLAGKIFKNMGINRIVLVSSPDHIPRCVKEAFLAFFKEDGLRVLTYELLAAPCQIPYTGSMDVKIQEKRKKGLFA